MEKFLENVAADGGGDEAEDIIGGFEILKSNFQLTKIGANIIFLIADSPCHGK
jgi:hypothetical protein